MMKHIGSFIIFLVLMWWRFRYEFGHVAVGSFPIKSLHTQLNLPSCFIQHKNYHSFSRVSLRFLNYLHCYYSFAFKFLSKNDSFLNWGPWEQYPTLLRVPPDFVIRNHSSGSCGDHIECHGLDSGATCKASDLHLMHLLHLMHSNVWKKPTHIAKDNFFLLEVYIY